ncbi:hypothetical protein AB0D99_10610 [Streptomyces sp. NPDC047971]|uniref:hypothetical protein n=1 Tax=Streptomyces sp. NPDC047971 TaxID=3154499 RepID=UPI00340ED0CA
MIADKIRTELDQLGVKSEAPGLSAVAIRLAEALDRLDPSESPTAQAVVADKLHALMVRLRALAPIQEQGDGVDDITREREERRAEVKRRAS